MIQSENITDLLAALVEVQCEMPSFPKNAKAYGYNYTDLDTIVIAIKPLLHKYGIAYMQSVGGGLNGSCLSLTTRIFNKGGQYIEDTVALPEINGEKTKTNAAQVVGMAITYMRRYALCAMLGITSDEDIDANTFIKNAERQQKQQQQTQQPKQETLYADGKPATEEQRAQLKALRNAKSLSGMPLFSTDEFNSYMKQHGEKTAAQMIEMIENFLRNRRADAPELPENRRH